MQCGPIRYTAARPDSAPHDLEVVPRSRFAKFDLPPDAGIQDVFHHLATDHERTRAVAADVGDAFSQGRKVLVLTERTEHLDAIRSALWRGAYRAPVQRSSIPIRARVRAGKPVPDALLLPYLSQSTPGFRKIQTVSGQSADDNPVVSIAACFPLPWSHYARLLTVRNLNGREFYEAEALRGGWTIRQLNRQIESQFYERTVLSKDKSNMLRRGSAHLPADVVTPDDEIKDPYFLEFLALKDEYSETDLESALIMKLETFLFRTRRRLRFRWPATPPAGRRRVVSSRSAIFPQAPSMPDYCRSKARQVHACRRRSNALVRELCPRALGIPRRESASGPNSAQKKTVP